MTSLLLVLSLAMGPPNVTPELAEGIRLVDEGDLAGAVPALDRALVALAGQKGLEAERAWGYVYLGMAQLGLGQAESARASLRQAWSLREGARLDPMQFPPRVVALYDEVGQEQRTPARPHGSKRTLAALGGAAGVGIGAALASLGGGASATPTPSGPQAAPRPVSVRLFNNDDLGRVFVDGALVREVGIGEDTGPFDIGSRLQPGSNEVVFELVNAHGGISYGFEVRLGDAIVFQETCGIVFRAGCENDRKFPAGVVRRFSYVVQR